MKKYLFQAVIALSSILPLSVLAQQPGPYSNRTFKGLVDALVSFVNPVAILLISLTILVFLYNMMRYVWTAGDSKEHGEATRAIGWSLLGLVVLFGMWGILSIASMTLFGTSGFGGVDPCRVDPGSSSVSC